MLRDWPHWDMEYWFGQLVDCQVEELILKQTFILDWWGSKRWLKLIVELRAWGA